MTEDAPPELTAQDASTQGADASPEQGMGSGGHRLWLMALSMAVVAALATSMWVLRLTLSSHGFSVQWWYLAAGFAAAEMLPMHLEIRRNTWSTTPTAIPLVVGLMYSAPWAVVTGQLLGVVIAWGIIRR